VIRFDFGRDRHASLRQVGAATDPRNVNKADFRVLVPPRPVAI
jgi:hypothetical protein